MSTPRVIAAVLSRIAHVSPGGSSVRPRLHRWRGVHIGSNVWLGLYVYIDELHPEGLSIGNNCSIGIRTSIVTHFYWGPRRAVSNGKVVIEDNVYIGPHCVILPNVRIGEGAVIQAGTVVSQNVPAHTLWGAPSAGPLANVTVPLTATTGYNEFLRGLRPKASAQQRHAGEILSSVSSESSVVESFQRDSRSADLQARDRRSVDLQVRVSRGADL